jgi:hypothetical protein
MKRGNWSSSQAALSAKDSAEAANAIQLPAAVSGGASYAVPASAPMSPLAQPSPEASKVIHLANLLKAVNSPMHLKPISPHKADGEAGKDVLVTLPKPALADIKMEMALVVTPVFVVEAASTVLAENGGRSTSSTMVLCEHTGILSSTKRLRYPTDDLQAPPQG